MDFLAKPSQHDIAYSWLTTILPADMSSPYGMALGTFAATLTFLASLMLGFHILVGIVSSAYSGKVLGERYHQIWVPLRVVIGFGLLVPIAGGFSSAHYALRDLAGVPSINIGNASWVKFVEAIASDEVPIVAHAAGGSKLVLDIVEHEICAAVTNAAGSYWGIRAPLPPAHGEATGRSWFGGGANRVEWNYGQDCGRFSFGNIEDRPAFTAARQTAVSEVVKTVRATAGQYAAIFERTDMPLSPEQAMKGVSLGTLPDGLAQGIRDMGTSYDNAIAAAAKADASEVEAESRSKLVEAARQDGWINAGAYWRGLAQISELTTALTSEKPERIGIRYGDGNTGFEKNVQAALQTLRYHIAGEEARVGLTANDLAAAGDESGGFLAKALGPMTRRIGEWTMSRDESVDPVGRLIGDGHAMMTASGLVVTGTGIAMLAANTAPGKAIGADGAASWFAGFIAVPTVVLWLLGAIRAYVLPFLPFVFVFVGAVKWGAALLEASIALICWAFIWVRMDGDELIAQQQRTGLMLLFNIILRPVFVVLGLCASYLLFGLAYGTLDRLMPTAFYGQTGGTTTGVGALLVLLVLKTFLLWFLAVNLFGIISDLPDRIGEWFGVPGAGKMGEKGDFNAAAVGAATAVNQGRGVGSVGSNLSDSKGPKPNPNDSGGKGTGGGMTSRLTPAARASASAHHGKS